MDWSTRSILLNNLIYFESLLLNGKAITKDIKNDVSRKSNNLMTKLISLTSMKSNAKEIVKKAPIKKIKTSNHPKPE